jgi:transcriptional regulator with XRE-family HTH domain
MGDDSVPAVAGRIKEELARRRLSRAALAAKAKISISTLEKGLSGQRQLTEQTLTRLEDVLGVKLRSTLKTKAQFAPEGLGSYARPAVSWLEGNYMTLRPASSRPQNIYSYVTEVSWDSESNHLVFRELMRTDKAYAQSGSVAVPHQSGHIYFVTNKHGQHRLMLLSRHVMSGELHGLLLTLQQGRGTQLQPIAMPVALVPITRLKEPPVLGIISEAHHGYERLRGYLDRTLADGFALMLGGR